MGLLRTRRLLSAVDAARVAPAGATALGSAALALAGITSDPYTASPVTRGQALSWPALNNGIRVYTNIGSQLPLLAESDLGVSDDTATFLDTLDPSMPSGWTVGRTIEALIEYAAAYWVTTSRYATGFPRTVEFVDNELVTEHSSQLGNGLTRVDHYSVGGEKWLPRDVIVFSGIMPGILSVGAASIRTALANLHAARMYAENPAPHMYLTDTEGAEVLEEDDAVEYLQALTDAVRTHGTAYLGGLAITQVGWSARELQLVDARHADAVEAARLLSLPTFYVAAPNQGSSLTYSNQVDIRRDVISALHNFAGPIEGRLSLPDVTPRGTKVRFDSASFYEQVTPGTPPDTATTTQTPPSTPGSNL